MYVPMDISLISLCCLLLVSTKGDVCPYQACSCQGSYIECQSRRLNSVPLLVIGNNTSFTVLMLDANRITTIPAGSLPANLKEISLSQNPITTIATDAFNESATTLNTLRIDGAHFTRIPDAFLYLRNLNSLYIYNTAIQDWNPNAMINVGRTVATLFLGNVSLTTWPTWMHDFPKLTNFYMSDSSFASLPDDALDLSANNLALLSFINGGLTAVPKTLSNHKALKSIYLQNNQISDVTWLPHLSNLTDLDMNFNKISDAVKLSSAIQPFAKSLKSIDFVGNLLTAIPDFSFLTKIDSLDFARNRISDPDAGAVPSNLNSLSFEFNLLPSIPRVLTQVKGATDVSMSSNSVTVLRGSDFPPQTTSVRFQNNLIFELTDSSFPINSEIGYLYLDNNPLSKISLHAFDNVPHLQELHLRQSLLTRLPLALLSLSHLFSFDISNSTALVCTCAEKSLEPWVKNFSWSNDVLGDCGQSSIYNFFTSLSSACPSESAIV